VAVHEFLQEATINILSWRACMITWQDLDWEGSMHVLSTGPPCASVQLQERLLCTRVHTAGTS
jgi:hypothetical protein